MLRRRESTLLLKARRVPEKCLFPYDSFGTPYWRGRCSHRRLPAGRRECRRDGDASARQCERMRGRTSPPEVRGCAMQQWQGQETLLCRLGKAFHIYADDTAHEPLPRRWVELIRYLDEHERRSSEQSQRAAGGEPSRAETEHAVTTQEKLLHPREASAPKRSFCAN